MTSNNIPDFYLSEKECLDASKKKYNLNPRYPQLTQSIYTAGDINQFEMYRKACYFEEISTNLLNTDNEWSKIYVPLDEWKKYKNLTNESVNNTFQYIFNKFKKGIFIKIINNNLEVFLPFSNVNYKNEWGNRIDFDTSKFKSLEDFLIFSSHKQGYSYIASKDINKNPYSYYANNCLIRYEYPIAENDKGVSAIKDMLTTLCLTRKVPDIELFINKRDFPIIKKDDSEPYEQIYGEKYKLISHRYDSYCPILSPVTTLLNTDIAFPTAEDWVRVSSQEDGKFFTGFCRNYKYNFNTEWDKKIPTAIFRGSSTGCGVTIDTNPRLKISHLSSISPIENGYKLLDAGITKWNLRPRKIIGQKILQMIEPDKKLEAGEMNAEKQSNYKYIVNVDGHVSAFRLSLELSMGCTLLLVKSKYIMWFRKYLVEYVHYIPIEENLSDLFDKIRWCREHDYECKKIAENAKNFYNTYLKKNGILDFIQELFYNIKQETGEYFYNSIKVSDIIKNFETKIISTEYSQKLSHIINFPNVNIQDMYDRFYWMEGIRMYLEKNTSKFTNTKQLYTNKTKNISIFETRLNNTLSENLFIIKELRNICDDKYIYIEKCKDIVNEIFVGKILNDLIREIPNFRYTYLLNNHEENYTSGVFENCKGDTFQQYIQKGCSIEKFYEILLIICLALCVAQERHGFVHFDLYPWNIIIKKVQKQTIYYQFKEHIFTVETDIIPIIIDYGKSNIQHKGLHFGTLKPFEMNTIQDCYCIVISSVYEMLNRNKKIEKNDLKSLLYITGFFNETLKNENDLMQFVSTNKKFNEMIYGDKCVLKSKNPFDVFLHLSEMDITININQITYPEKIKYPFVLSNPEFYYDILINQDPLINIQKYTDNIYNQYDTLLGESRIPLVYVNTLNMLDTVLKCLRKFIQRLPLYLENRMIPSIEVIKNIKDISSTTLIGDDIEIKNKKAIFVLRTINRLLSNYLPTKYTIHFADKYDDKNLINVIQEINTNKKILPSMYTSETFSIPSKILTIIQGDIERENIGILSFRNMYIFNILFDMNYKLSNEIDTALLYKNLILISPIVLLTHNANINTIRYISKILYENDLKKLKKRSISAQVNKVINVIKNILMNC